MLDGQVDFWSDLMIHDTLQLCREPGPVLFSLVFSDKEYIGPLHGGNNHSQLGAFSPQWARNPLFGSEMK